MFFLQILLTLYSLSAPNYIQAVPIIFVVDSFYIFGGRHNDTDSSIIGRLDEHENWSSVGEMLTARRGHNVIFDGSSFIIVGGYNGTFKSETCTMQNGAISCEEQALTLTDHTHYPEVFLVSPSFCKQIP